MVAKVTTRSRIAAGGAVVGLVLAGLLCALLLDGSIATFLTILLVSVAIVVAVALVFYEVGLSEDRERAREAERRGRSQ